MRGRGLEHAYGLGVPRVLVGPPANLPRGALRVVPRRKLLVHLPEGALRALIVALQDVVGREIVEGFLRPALRRELVDNPLDDAEILVVVAELARGDRIEKERFALPCAFLEIRFDA